MSKTIKVIDLLQDFADEKEIIMPQYVRYLDRNTDEKAIMLVCEENIIDKLDKKMIKLNDYVEILEDNTEDIEEIKGWGLATDYKDFETTNHTLDRFGNKINELVKEVNSINKKIK